MRNLRTLSLIFLISFAASCASTPVSKFTVEKDLVYVDAPERHLTVDVYRPETLQTSPAVIVIHGGGWARRSGDMMSVSEDLARAGFTAFNVTYRLAPKNRFPTAVDDIKEAIQWVKANAKKYSIDTSRIYLWGYSAGGHLALLTSFEKESGIKAVVAGGAPTDLTAYPNSPMIRDFIGFEYMDRPELWAQASPQLNLAQAKRLPIFLYHGSFDQIVGIDQMQNMETKLKENNFEVETYQVKWLGHLATYAFAQSAIDRGIDFLKRH